MNTQKARNRKSIIALTVYKDEANMKTKGA